MPNSNLAAHEDISDDGGIWSYKNVALVKDVEVVEIHDVTGSTEGLAVFFGCLDSLG